MPYPMTSWPTLEEFIKRACVDYDATLETKPDFLVGPRGKVTVRYLRRNGREAILPEIGEHDHLTPTLLRSLCSQLGLPAKDFGFTLEGWEDDVAADERSFDA